MSRTLLCYGDSNTHGTMPMAEIEDMGRFGPGIRWPHLLAGKLNGWTVIEEGLPGRTTVHDDPIEGPHRNGLSVLPAILESHRPIDVVLIMLGTNDLKCRFSVNASDVAHSLERLVRAVEVSRCGPGAGAPQVLLVAPPPILEAGCLAGMFEGGAEKSRGLAARIAESARRMGVPFLDTADVVAVSEIDGIHYDEPAQEALATAFAGAILRHFG